MIEFETDITAFLDSGLRRDFRNKRNSPALIGCNNLKLTEWGIAPYQPIAVPISNAELSSWSLLLEWPYPRLFRGMKYTFLATKNRLFYVNEGNWSLQGVDIYSYSEPTKIVSPIIGDLWQFIDFYDTFVFTNGSGCVFHVNLRNMLGQSTPEKVFYSTALRATAGSSYKGRAVMAGFDPERTWNTKLREVFALGSKTASSGISSVNAFKGFSDNFVMWSSIGGGDLLFWFDENVSFNFSDVGWIQNGSSGYGVSRRFVLDAFRKNQLGWMPLEWPGMIRGLKPLGSSLIAYGDGGVSELFSVADPVATLGQRVISRVGIANGGAVAGDELEHLYMDSSGVLWHLEAGKLPVRLGYEEWFETFVSGEPIISFDPSWREFYICDGFKSFVLTRRGLSRHSQILTSVIYADGQLLGLGTQPAEMDTQASIVTEVFDLGSSLIKTINSVEFSFTSHFQGVQVAVDYRYKRFEDFKRTPFRTIPEVAQRGYVRFPVAGVEFRLVIKWADFSLSEAPDRVVIKWSSVDKTNLRTRHSVSAAVTPAS